MKQFFRFCIVGTVGFVVDAGVLYLIVYFIYDNPYFARVGSFIAAASTTWILNRRLTFKVQHTVNHKEWLYYVALMIIGALFNYGTYAFCLNYWNLSVNNMLWLAVAAGSVAGLFVNFVTSRRLFRSRIAVRT